MQETPSQVPAVMQDARALRQHEVDIDRMEPDLLSDLLKETRTRNRWNRIAILFPLAAFLFRNNLGLGSAGASAIFVMYFVAVTWISFANRRNWVHSCEEFGMSEAQGRELWERVRKAFSRLPVRAQFKNRKRDRVELLLEHYGQEGYLVLPKTRRTHQRESSRFSSSPS